jgi:hypothetical protein
MASCKAIQLGFTAKETRFGRVALSPTDGNQLLIVSALGINYVRRMRLATLQRKCISAESTSNACFDLESKIPLVRKAALIQRPDISRRDAELSKLALLENQ